MDESWNLLLILAAVYLLECLVWLRRGGVAFTSWLGKMWQVRFPGLFFSNWRGGLVFLQPVPPLGRVLTCEQFLFSVSPEAVYSYSAVCVDPGWRAVQPAKLVLFKNIEKIESRAKEVWINSLLFLKCGSECHAGQTAFFLRQLNNMPAKKRVAEIDRFLDDSFDREKIAARLDAFRQESRTLQILSTLLFFYLFGATPLVFWLLGLRQSWIPLVAILLLQTVSISILFRRAHKRLFTTPNDDWFVPCLTAMLAPSAAIRVRDALSRHLLLGFHPMAVAAHLCSRSELQTFAARAVRDMRFPRLPVCPNEDFTAAEVEQSFRLLQLEKVESLLRKEKIDVAAICRSPKPTESVHRAYCPRCEMQFVTTEGQCRECGGRSLQPLALD